MTEMNFNKHGIPWAITIFAISFVALMTRGTEAQNTPKWLSLAKLICDRTKNTEEILEAGQKLQSLPNRERILGLDYVVGHKKNEIAPWMNELISIRPDNKTASILQLHYNSYSVAEKDSLLGGSLQNAIVLHPKITGYKKFVRLIALDSLNGQLKINDHSINIACLLMSLLSQPEDLKLLKKIVKIRPELTGPWCAVMNVRKLDKSEEEIASRIYKSKSGTLKLVVAAAIRDSNISARKYLRDNIEKSIKYLNNIDEEKLIADPYSSSEKFKNIRRDLNTLSILFYMHDEYAKSSALKSFRSKMSSLCLLGIRLMVRNDPLSFIRDNYQHMHNDDKMFVNVEAVYTSLLHPQLVSRIRRAIGHQYDLALAEINRSGLPKITYPDIASN